MNGAVVVSTKDLPPNATMAHVAAKAGAFSSATQARKNGVDGPVTLGVHRITKKVMVEIVDRELREGDQAPADPRYRPDLDPGFWAEYVHPRDPIQAAMQYPITDPTWPDRMASAYYQKSVADRRDRLTRRRIHGMVLEGIKEGRMQHVFDMAGLRLDFTDSDVVDLMDDDPKSFFPAARAHVRRALGLSLIEKFKEMKLSDVETPLDAFFSFAPTKLVMETL